MKILLVNTQMPDYGQSMLYDGLARCANVYGTDAVDISIYPMNVHLGGLETWEWMPKRPLNAPLIQNLDIDAFNCVIVTSCKSDTISTYHNLKKFFRNMPPSFLVDGEDNEGINEWAVEVVKPVAIFKREMIQGKEYPINCYPCPFSCFLYDKATSGKNIGVFVTYAPNHESRNQVTAELLKLNNQVQIIWNGHINYKHYLDRLRNSKIALSSRGYGYDTVRFWEVLGNIDVMLMADESPLILPNPLTEGLHFVQYNTDNVLELAKMYLNDDNVRLNIAKSGHEFCMKYHSTQKRAKYVLDIIEETL